jgi:chromosome segregation ATPase
VSATIQDYERVNAEF